MTTIRTKPRILANISEKLPYNKKPILVGGSAVEFYTLGTCKSIDIDLLADRDSLIKVLEEMGFSKIGRHWFYTKDLGIEIVGESVEGRRVVDRLNACKHWKSP